jgi:hypothetical protein
MKNLESLSKQLNYFKNLNIAQQAKNYENTLKNDTTAILIKSDKDEFTNRIEVLINKIYELYELTSPSYKKNNYQKILSSNVYSEINNLEDVNLHIEVLGEFCSMLKSKTGYKYTTLLPPYDSLIFYDEGNYLLRDYSSEAEGNYILRDYSSEAEEP